MTNQQFERHLDVYEDRYELFQDGKTNVFRQGFQDTETQKRYERINRSLADGFLEKLYQSIPNIDFNNLSEENQTLIRNIVNGITSEVGRALVGLTFLQLTIKSIEPDQCVRLHKGTTRKGSFSWEKGISMRTIDSTYNTPFLRQHGLLSLNKYGLFMTRSLAENYPYTKLYKAEMRGPFSDWIAVVDAIEDNTMPPKLGLCYMMSVLQNRSERFKALAEQACTLIDSHMKQSFDSIRRMIVTFFNKTTYSARSFEVVIHCFFQSMMELRILGDAEVAPLSQMRSANKKHDNVADIELTEDGVIYEAWDAKYGKPYLRDELDELREKLLTHPDVRVAGFVVDSSPDLRRDIIDRKHEIEIETSTEINLFSFDEWVDYEVAGLSSELKDLLARKWLTAIVESFAQKRRYIAPIDEPCDAWIVDLIFVLNE